MGVLDIADRVWPVTRNLMKGHTTVYRLTRGILAGAAVGAEAVAMRRVTLARGSNHLIPLG